MKRCYRVPVTEEMKEAYVQACEYEGETMNGMLRKFLKDTFYEDLISIKPSVMERFVFDNLGIISLNRMKDRFTVSVNLTKDPMFEAPEVFSYLDRLGVSRRGFVRACIAKIAGM